MRDLVPGSWEQQQHVCMLKDDFLRTYLDRIQVIVVSLLPEAGLVHLGIGSLFIYAACET